MAASSKQGTPQEAAAGSSEHDIISPINKKTQPISIGMEIQKLNSKPVYSTPVRSAATTTSTTATSTQLRNPLADIMDKIFDTPKFEPSVTPDQYKGKKQAGPQSAVTPLRPINSDALLQRNNAETDADHQYFNDLLVRYGEPAEDENLHLDPHKITKTYSAK